MTEIAFDAVKSWMATPIGGRVAIDNPAVGRMADVVLEAMNAAGHDDPDLQLMVLTKVSAMIVAGMIRHAQPADARAILERVGLLVQDEALAFVRASKRDLRKAS